MSVSTTIEDTTVLAKRNLLRIPRQPDLLIAYTVQPVMFVLLFVYVFGGAIQTPGFDYVDFLMPGIIVQSIAFGGFVTALGLSEDVKKGLIDRFRSLPMSRAAVLNARTSSDILLNCLSLVVLFAVGFAAGFNFIDATVGEIVLGIVLCLYLGYAFSWIFALIGLYSSSPETANSIGFTLIFPLTFASSVFVPAESMPDGLRQFAEANPFTTISDAVRSLWLNTPANSDIWMAFIWCTGADRDLRAAGGEPLPEGRRDLKSRRAVGGSPQPHLDRAAGGGADGAAGDPPTVRAQRDRHPSGLRRARGDDHRPSGAGGSSRGAAPCTPPRSSMWPAARPSGRDARAVCPWPAPRRCRRRARTRSASRRATTSAGCSRLRRARAPGRPSRRHR